MPGRHCASCAKSENLQWNLRGSETNLVVEVAMDEVFTDRSAAGRQLARRLENYRGQNLIILALPRGGVPVGFEVARALNAPMDVIVVRKIGFPGNPELALGAIASGGARMVNNRLARYIANSKDFIASAISEETIELKRREKAYRRDRPPLDLAGKTVILVDDGLATGASMAVAIAAVRQLNAYRVVVAVPVAPAESVEHTLKIANDVVCLQMPEDFRAVGQFYQDFTQVTDEEVSSLIASASAQKTGTESE